MNSLTQSGKSKAIQEQLTLVLADQLGNTEVATKLAQAGAHEIVVVRGYAAEKVARTIKTARQIVKAATLAGRITPDKELQLRRRTQAYVQEMLGIAYDTSDAIVEILMRW